MDFDPFMDQNKKYKPDDIINLRFYNEQTLPLSNGFKFLYNIDTFNWFVMVFIASNVGWMIPEFSQQTTGGICPDKNIQHWEKIDFKILSPEVAKKLNVTDNTELNIKVLGNSNTIEDMKQKNG
jgi:hypothetical protein